MAQRGRRRGAMNVVMHLAEIQYKPAINPSKRTTNPRITAPRHSRGADRRAFRPFWWFLMLGLLSMPLSSQLPPGASGSNIEYPYFDKQSRRPVSLLLGDEAIPQADGLMLIKGLRIQTFDYVGNARRTNFVVRAPSCLLDVRRRIASSAGPLVAAASDGSFSISGEGFQWRQVESHLIISNNIETLVDRRLIEGRNKNTR